MKKLESTLPNMVLSLLLICSIMAAALALVYGATKEPIAQAYIKGENDAVKEVVPAFDNDPNADQWEADGLVFYPAKKNGELVGTAVKTFTESGFSGRFDVMVGFLPDGTIYNSKVLSHKETPGLGSKMSDPKFHDQFNNLKIEGNLSVKKDGGTIDAITAATISSRAYCDAINRAHAALTNNNNTYDSTSGATKGGQE
ncbi:MAG: RnfABCDGE type electron transport complex subunit G [Prevotellaceae bacterium]|jgi:electron transport complex protein RnfG|nr:RnfABCDGE type electron transport complex subunit G [Prevotellaceae bacterium]